jgi:5-(carboxyamino)imidazole ribonucleotide mutase
VEPTDCKANETGFEGAEELVYSVPMPTVTFLLGSKVDVDFTKKIAAVLDEFGVSSEIIVASAHKVPEKVVQVIEKLNARTEPTVVITCVGMSNGLGGVVAGSCVHPVVNCPPHATLEEYMVDIHSSLRMPSDVPVMTVAGYKNAAIAALRILGESDKKLQKKLMERIQKIKSEY